MYFFGITYICDMKTEVTINADILTWAITRAGYELHEMMDKVPNVRKWLSGEKKPTVKQLEEFSNTVHLPYGYFFLPEPPNEKLSFPFFRTKSAIDTRVSVNIYDTILLLKQRQDWLREYLLDNGYDSLPFVGKYHNLHDVQEIVANIRETLGLDLHWASTFSTWQDAQDHLIEHIEEKGIITVFNGVVENNAHRSISVEECRGFVLVDTMAPFMFINNADSKSAQMFTIVHELAHIWIGQSAGFDNNNLQPADDPIERLCDKVAAEFLVPERAFISVWQKNRSFTVASKYFKVSEIVIARRALDTQQITSKEFHDFYNDYMNREYGKKGKTSGGDFYATTKKRLSITFASHVDTAVKSGALLYRDACKLTSLKGDTFHTFFTEHL